jgi:heavy metal sensor kinase
MNTRSLYFRLILWYSVLVILISLAFGAYTYHGVQSRLYGELEQTFTRRAHQIADNILVYVHEKSSAEIASQIRSVYSPSANNRFIRILRDDRSILYISMPPKDGLFTPSAIAIPESLESSTKIESIAGNTPMLIVNVPVTTAGESFLIEMGAPTDELERTLHGLVVTLLSGLPFMIIIVSAGGYLLVRRALKPVENIRATAEQITFGNLSNRLPVVATGDALEHLSVTLNQMLVRLEDAYLQASRFSADASHELRTPLTIIRGELESLIQTESGLPEHLQERIGGMLEETERLSHIAESLFTISRLDGGEAKAKHITFELAELTKATTEQMSLLAEEKSIVLMVKTGEPVFIKGDPARLKQVIVNLLDNAIKYTPANGNITIDVSNIEHKAKLTFTDNGMGIPADALPHIFERFYRADKVRSREQGGAGLGLAIVHSICQAHGGIIEVESTENKGTTFRVILPSVEAI